MNEVLNCIIQELLDGIKSNFLNWIITIPITFFTVRSATKHYYGSAKKRVAKGILELGLRSLMNLSHEDDLPDNAQAIFVEYKGRCYRFNDPEKCRFGERIRKTIEVAGGNKAEVSKYKPLNYGVLGIANYLQTPVYYDFSKKELYRYSRGTLLPIEVATLDKETVCMLDGEMKSLGETRTQRDVMIAVPLLSNNKLVGGITFDLKASYKNMFKKNEKNDSIKAKRKKERTNIKFFKSALRTAQLLVNAYFKEKGDELE